ncbi:MAG: flagellar hook-associated protein FlgL [Vampirovibrionales bacterium]|nr:flagellar hook-associated protein FlgL [Vampirovibrionales bacterium]
MSMRITNAFLNNQSVNYLNNNLGILSTLQEKLSSGKNINRASDDPIGLTRMLNISNNLTTDNRYSKNVDNAIAEVNAADTAVDNMVSLVQKAQELVTQASNFSNNQTGRDAIAQEINQIIDQMVQLGNTEVGGRYVFGGFKTNSPPFTRTGQYQVDFTGTPTAEPWQRQVEIAKGVTVTININGADLLGTSNGTAGPLPVTVTGSGIFQTLTTTLLDLQAAGDPAQLTEIRNRLDDLSGDLQTITSRQSVIGAISNRLSLTQDRIEQRGAILTQQYASIQNIDQAKMIADLNYQENVFQASLAVTGRVLQSSLLQFIG